MDKVIKGKFTEKEHIKKHTKKENTHDNTCEFCNA